ncbi:MAG: nickel pincer cofactor biosynthesis protein LarB [Candidatus Hydrogenedentes bacterium]|nr:nickel pincer cofactor biosynthesis protein LarB [Candidatus Hydrogenedentota bacterium]
MDRDKLKELLESVAAGNTSTASALERLRALPFEDIGFAKVDHHRDLRQGHPEAIFGAGKTPEQIVQIMARMREKGSNILVTRCSSDAVASIVADFPDAQYHEAARAVTLVTTPMQQREGYIAIVCAGTSDLPVAEEAAVTCEFNGNAVKRVYDVGVAGLHRLLGQHETLTKANTIVVCAGMEGALPSVVGGLVDVPVIAVPTSVGYGANFGGLSALLTMLNSCATGIAVVNIDNGFGAGMLASMINRIAGTAR